MYNFQSQKGQALLIVVLVMVVVLTVGLAVVARSIVNLKNSQQEVGSQQALSAAESGIEQSIKSGVSIPNGVFTTSTTYATVVTPVSKDADFLLNGNNKVSQDDATYIWLTSYPADASQTIWAPAGDGNLDIYWGSDGTNPCNNSAIEVAVVSGTSAAPIVRRYAYDGCVARASKNGFTASTNANHGIAGITLYNKAKLPPITNGFFIRVVPLYGDSYIGVSREPGTPILPDQGSTITSTGTNGGNVQRKLDVFQGYPEFPAELFPFSLFWP